MQYIMSIEIRFNIITSLEIAVSFISLSISRAIAIGE